MLKVSSISHNITEMEKQIQVAVPKKKKKKKGQAHFQMHLMRGSSVAS